MHARALVQVAATIAFHAQLLIRARQPFAEGPLQVYWAAARCRQDGWSRAIKKFSTEQIELDYGDNSDCPRLQSVVEEVLISEPLTRVWAAVCELADFARGANDASPIARSVFESHLDARNRVLGLMVHGYGMRIEEAVELNRLRLRYERLTDTILALVGNAAARSQWSFQPRQVRQLSDAIKNRPTELSRRMMRSLVLASVTSATIQQQSRLPAAHPDLNRRIAGSLMACFPSGLFDGTGRLISSRQCSLLMADSDVQGELEFSNYRPSGTQQPHVESSDVWPLTHWFPRR